MRQTVQHSFKVDAEPDWSVTRVYAPTAEEDWVRVDDGWRIVQRGGQLGALLTWPRLLAAAGGLQDVTDVVDETWFVVWEGQVTSAVGSAMQARLRAGFQAQPGRPAQVYAGKDWDHRTLRSVVAGGIR